MEGKFWEGPAVPGAGDPPALQTVSQADTGLGHAPRANTRAVAFSSDFAKTERRERPRA